MKILTNTHAAELLSANSHPPQITFAAPNRTLVRWHVQRTALLLLVTFLLSWPGYSQQKTASLETGSANSKPKVAGPRPAGPKTALDKGDWTSYNGSLTSERYSPLTQITTANVASLKQVGMADLGEPASFESGVIVANNTLFVTTQLNTYALDPVSGKQKWKHNFPFTPLTGHLNVNRGVVFSKGRVIRGVDAGYLVALDATTGKEVWKTKASEFKKGESLSSAPVVWNGMVFMGIAGGDYTGVRGRMMAFRETDGKQLWSFDVVPLTGKGSDSWPASTPEKPRQGGGIYSSYTIDAEKGLLYIGTGNPGPDWDKRERPGLNLYTCSVVVLDAKTGVFKNYYQLSPNDYHDWNLSAVPALIKTAGGKNLVLAAGKDGFLHALEQSQLKLVYKTPVTTIENIDAPFSTDKFTRFFPGTHGGVQWNGPAFNPTENLIFVNSVDWAVSVKLALPGQAASEVGEPSTGGDKSAPFGKNDPKEDARGWLTAVDADKGSVKWKYHSPTPLLAGLTTTASGLVITGDLNGNLMAFNAKDGQQLLKQNTGTPIAGGIITYMVNNKQYIAAAIGFTSGNWEIKDSGNARVVVYALP